MVCESPGDPIGFAALTACGSAFAFGHSDALVKAGLGDEQAIHDVADYFLTAPDTMATMVSNHDYFAGKRLWDAMGGDAGARARRRRGLPAAARHALRVLRRGAGHVGGGHRRRATASCAAR